jgi:hypothetical protein
LDGRLGKIATLLEDAETDILAFYAFPISHSRKIRSTNPLCIEQNDEWLVGRGYLSAESITLCLADSEKPSMKQIKEEMPELQAA